MNWKDELLAPQGEPLDTLLNDIGFTGIFRTMGFVGDSLSSGEFVSLDKDGKYLYHDLYDYSWGRYIGRKYGMTVHHFSRGGMTAQEFMESYADFNGLWNPAFACQAYVIALGYNDLYGIHKLPLGSMADIDDSTRPTVAYYYAAIVRRLKTIQPQAKFFFVTMPCEDGYRDELKQAHADLMHEFAAYFENAYVIDLWKYAPVYDTKFKEVYYLHSHMTPTGYILTARMIDSYIDYIIRRHPQDFKRVPFIGSQR